MRHEYAVINVKIIRLFLISINQILGSVNVDKSNVSGFHRENFPVHSSNSSHFSSALVTETSWNGSHKNVARKPLAPKAEAEKAWSANNVADETATCLFQLHLDIIRFEFRRYSSAPST